MVQHVDIGPVGHIGPYGTSRGRVVGVPGVKALAGLAVAALVSRRTRDYNDKRVGAPVQGTIRGVTVKPGPRGPKLPERLRGTASDPAWREEQRRRREAGYPGETSFDVMSEEEEKARWPGGIETAAKEGSKAGREARKKFTGPAPKKKKPGPLDISDLRRGTA